MRDRPHPLGWPRALHPRQSPCRIDAAKGPLQHRCSAEHREIVQSYRAWREVEEQKAEVETIGYAVEEAAYWTTHKRPTFRTYLLGLARV